MTAIGFQTLAFAYQVADVFAFLVLAASGLAIIFGMMGVINMAHGEFITCGAYVTTAMARTGVPLPLAILVGALAAGVLGIAARAHHRLPVLQSADRTLWSSPGASV